MERDARLALECGWSVVAGEFGFAEVEAIAPVARVSLAGLKRWHRFDHGDARPRQVKPLASCGLASAK